MIKSAPLSSSSGNVLFIILIAVCLFAALTYAVTQSSKGGAGNISREKVHLIASQFQQFKSSLTQAYTRLRVSGCSVENIHLDKIVSGQHFVYVGGTLGGALPVYGATSVAGNDCDLFSSNGGGVVLPYTTVTPFTLLAPYFSEPGNLYYMIGFEQMDLVGSSADDLVATIQMTTNDDITNKVCEEINRQEGLPTSTTDSNATLNAEIAVTITNMLTSHQINTDLFCDSGAIYIIVDPQ